MNLFLHKYELGTFKKTIMSFTNSAVKLFCRSWWLSDHWVLDMQRLTILFSINQTHPCYWEMLKKYAMNYWPKSNNHTQIDVRKNCSKFDIL